MFGRVTDDPKAAFRRTRAGAGGQWASL